MAARTVKIRHDENTRAKIKASQLINRLTNHVLGKVDMKPTQVAAALGLLKKSVPDLSSVELSGNLTVNHEEALDELDSPRETNSTKA